MHSSHQKMPKNKNDQNAITGEAGRESSMTDNMNLHIEYAHNKINTEIPTERTETNNSQE